MTIKDEPPTEGTKETQWEVDKVPNNKTKLKAVEERLRIKAKLTQKNRPSNH